MDLGRENFEGIEKWYEFEENGVKTIMYVVVIGRGEFMGFI
jgi:hypothetical protein